MESMIRILFMALIAALPLRIAAQCDTDNGGVLATQMVSGLGETLIRSQANGCITGTVVNGGLEMVGGTLSVVNGDTVGQVLRWTGTDWVPRLIIFSGGVSDTAYNAITDLGAAHVLGGPMTMHTTITGQQQYDFTLNNARNVVFGAKRTGGVANTFLNLGSTMAQGADIIHTNESDPTNLAIVKVNFFTGVDMAVKKGLNVGGYQVSDNGGYNYRVEMYAGDGTNSKSIQVDKNKLRVLYLDRPVPYTEWGYMVYDTLLGDWYYQSPDVVASQIAALISGSRVDAVADSAAFRAYNRNGYNVVVMADSLRGGLFRRCYSCVADQYMVFSTANGQKYERFGYQTISVRWFGRDSAAIQRALNLDGDVYFPPGPYTAGTHTVSKPKTIYGNGATIQQASAKSSGAVMFQVLANNVRFRGLKLRGQMSQSGEFSHLIAFGPDYGDGVQNGNVEDCDLGYCRGDAIIFRGTTAPCVNMGVRRVRARNVFRNGIAVIHAKNIEVDGFDADSIGLAAFDAEPDLYLQRNDNIHVRNFRGNAFWCGHHEDTVTANISLSAFEIDGSRQGCYPVNSVALPYAGIGIATRHSNNFSVSDGTIHNCDAFAVSFSNSVKTFRNVRFQNVTFENNGIGTWVNRAKLMNQDNAVSDSCATFVNCRMSGDGVIDQLGAPAGSVFLDCSITGFDRLLVSHRGNQTYRNCLILCSQDLIYDSYGPSSFYSCDISCSYILRAHAGAAVYVWRDCKISASVTPLPFNFFGPTPSNVRFIWKNNSLNGNYIQSAASGATIFSSDVYASGTSVSTLILPDVLLHPLNEIRLMNAQDGRTVNLDPEGSVTVNGGATIGITTSTYIYNNGSGWYTRKDGIFAVSGSNGVSATTTGGSVDVKLGGTLSQNTTISGGGAYDLTFSNPATRHRMQSKPLMLDVSDTPLYLGANISSPSTQFPDIAAGGAIYVTGGGSGPAAGYGNVVVQTRANNAFRVTCDGGITSEVEVTPGVVNFNGVGKFSGNLFIGGFGNITNINQFTTIPVYKAALSIRGNGYFSNQGDIPIVIGGAITGPPTEATTEAGGFIATTYGGPATNMYHTYGGLVVGSRNGFPIYLSTDTKMPKLTVSSTGVGVCTGIDALIDSFTLDGTMRLKNLPDAIGTEPNFIFTDAGGYVSEGPLPQDIVGSGNIVPTGATAGSYGGHNKYVEIEVNDRGQVIDIQETPFNMATYASSGGATTLTLQYNDYVIEADPTAGDLTLEFSGLEPGRTYTILGCCNLTNDIIMTGGNFKFSGQYGTVTTYTLSAGEHLEVVYWPSKSTYYVSKK